MSTVVGNDRNTSAAQELQNNEQLQVYPAYAVPSTPVEITNLYGGNLTSIGTMPSVSPAVSTDELSTSYAAPMSAAALSAYAFNGLLGSGLLKTASGPAMTFAATDHAGPVTGELASGATTDDIHPTFHGTGTANTLVSVVAVMVGADGKAIPGGEFEIGKTLVQQNGTWEFTPYTALKDGTYDFHIPQISSGHDSSAAFRLTIDRAWTDGIEPPVQPEQPEQPVPEQPTQPEQPTSKAMTFAATDHAGPVTGELASGATTDDIHPTFHGTGTANTLVSVVAVMVGADGKAIPGGEFEIGKTLIQQNGTWEFTPYTALKDGTYDFHITQISSGHDSSAAFRLTIDRAWTDGVEPPVQPEQPEQPVPEQPTQPEQPTAKAMTFAATDHAGPVTGELASGATTDDIHPTFHGTGTANTLVSVVAVMVGADGKAIPGGEFEIGKALVQQDGTWEFTPYTALKDGTYDFHITQISSGHDSSAAFRLTIDRAWTDGIEPPVQPEQPEQPTAKAMTFAATDHAGPVTGELANGATTDDIRPVFHGTGTANTLVSVVAVMVGADGKAIPGGEFEIGKALVQQDGTWEFTPYAPLKDGAYDFHISQGQESSAAFRLTIDRSWTDEVGASKGSLLFSHGLELDLSGLGTSAHNDNQSASESKASLPSMSNVLEIGTHELPLGNGGVTSVSAVAEPAGAHYAPVDFRPVTSFDELAIQHIVV